MNRTPSSLSVVFDMNTENPKNLVVNPLPGPKKKKDIYEIQDKVRRNKQQRICFSLQLYYNFLVHL